MKSAILAARSSLLFVGMVVLVVFFAVPIFLVIGFPRAPRIRRRLAAACGRVCLRWFAWSGGLGYTLEGGENLPAPGSGPTILFWRHESAWETFLSLVLAPEPTWVLKRDLLWVPILGWGIRLLDPIPIDRGAGRAAVARVLAVGARQLRSGRCLNFFPEGTRLAPDARRRYGLSGALLASSLGATIVPLAHDAGSYWPRRGFLKHPGRIRVVVGPPLVVTPGEDPEAINARVASWMEDALRRLRPA